MSREITIFPGEISKEYALFEGEEFQIYAVFNQWRNINKVHEAEFRIYPINKFRIRDVHFCAGRDQLEISVIAERAENPFRKQFSNFYMNEKRKEDVATIYFAEGEEYKETRCFTLPDTNPERQKGNILVGG